MTLPVSLLKPAESSIIETLQEASTVFERSVREQ